MNLYQQLTAMADEIESIDVRTSEVWYRRFAIFSANLGLLMPNISMADHLDLFKKTIRNQCWAKEEQHHFFEMAYDLDNSVGEILSGLSERPAIIATFHSGSYRLLGQVLAKMDIKFSLLLAADIAIDQGETFRRSVQAIGGPLPTAFDIIDAESPTAGLKMLRCLSRGESLLAYVDGNTGAGNQRSKTVPVSFMGGVLHVRQGLPWLAYRAGVPLHVIHCLRQGPGRARFKLGVNPLIVSDRCTPIASDAKQAMQVLYADLAAHITDEPWQWECWLYLQHYLLK